jgi:hypothetical protein
MSELKNEKDGTGSVRRYLLAGASATTLLAIAGSAAHAGEADRPTVWIELGGQLERVDGGLESFVPPFVSQIDTHVFTSPVGVQRPPRYATGFNGKLLIHPTDSDWIVSAQIRYGRANRSKELHEETQPATPYLLESIPYFDFYAHAPVTPAAKRLVDSNATTKSSHLVLDFQAGRDVGLGLFGRNGSSTIGAGVRFAQFSSRTDVTLTADPNFSISYKYSTMAYGFEGRFNVPQQGWDVYKAKGQTLRSFHGIGPSVYWDASTALLGHEDSAEVTVDWGVNFALLFGRQKVKTVHSTDDVRHFPNGLQTSSSVPYQHHYTYPRSHRVTVPNVGGFAGMSLKFPNAKISLGYRADVFFNALDGGIDTRKTYDRAFYGPFASFSLGF